MKPPADVVEPRDVVAMDDASSRSGAATEPLGSVPSERNGRRTGPSFDPHRVRADFPILATSVSAASLISWVKLETENK